MKKKFLFSFSLLLFSFISFSQVEVKYKNFDDLLFQAEDAFYAENYSKALVYFDTLSGIDTTRFNYYSYHIGLCYLYSNIDNNKILEYLEPAAQNMAGTFLIDLVYFNLGKAYQLFYRFDDAIEAYRKSLELDKTEGSPEFKTMVNKQIDMCKAGKELMKKPVNVQITNLGKKLNSHFPDYKPVITNDESSLIFTSRRNINKGGELDKSGKYFEDIFITGRNDFGNWKEPKFISDTINTKYHEASIELLDNGNTLLLYKGHGAKNGLYTSKFDGAQWLPPEIVSADINSQYKATSASISSDANTMYFVSEKKGGIGGKDIYKMDRKADGSWANPQNLGDMVNTAEDEESPFIDFTGKVLYFSSKGHNSMGGFDIFKSTLENDKSSAANPSSGGWSLPENIGSPVNTTADDVHFRMTANNRRGYYASSMTGGLGVQDIYQITFSRYSSPYKIIRGKLFAKGNLSNSKIIVSDATEKSYVSYVFNPDSNGNFILFLEPEKKYEMIISSDNFYAQKFNFRVPNIQDGFETNNLPYLNQQIFLKDINVFGNKIGEECSVVNAFIISEKDAYDSTVIRTDTLNKDYLNILHELTLSAADAEIKGQREITGFSSSPLLSLRKEKLIRITDPEINQFSSVISKKSYQNKYSNLAFWRDQKTETVDLDAKGQKFKALPPYFLKADQYDYGKLPETIKNLIANLLNNYFQDNDENLVDIAADTIFPKIIARSIKEQQSLRLIKNLPFSYLEASTAFQLSDLVKIIFLKSFSEEMYGMDSLGLSRSVKTENLGLSNDQIIDLFTTPAIELDHFQISKRIDIHLERTINDWQNSSSGSRTDSAQIAEIVKKQIVFMIGSQLDRHNKLILMRQKLEQLVNLKIKETIKSHFDSLDFIAVVETDSLKLFPFVKNSVEDIANVQMRDNALVKALFIPNTELTKIAFTELSKIYQKDLPSLKIQRLEDEISLSGISSNYVLLRGNIENSKDEIDMSTSKILMVDSSSDSYAKYVGNPEKNGNYFMLLEGGKTYEMIVIADNLQPEKLMYQIPLIGENEMPFHSQKIIINPIESFDKTVGQEFTISNIFNVPQTKISENTDSISFALEFDIKYLMLLENHLRSLNDSVAISSIQSENVSNPFKTAYLAFNSEEIRSSTYCKKIKTIIFSEQDKVDRIVENGFNANAYSNINFYGTGKPDNMILSLAGNDSIFVLPPFFTHFLKFDFNKISQNVSEALLDILDLQTEKIDESTMADFCSLVLTALQKENLVKLEAVQRRTTIFSTIEKSANSQRIALESSGDKSSAAYNLVRIINTQMDEQKRKIATEEKIAELTRLHVLQKINIELGKVNPVDLDEIDIEQFSGIITRELSALGKNDFAQLTEAQKLYLEKINISEIINDEIKNATANLDNIKREKMAEIVSASKYNNKIIIRGNIAKDGKILSDAIIKITLIDKADSTIVPYVYNPNSNGDYLLFPENGRDYDMIVETEGMKPEKLRLNLSNASRLSSLPFLQQQIVLKTVDALNETIGQELLVFNSFESTAVQDDSSAWQKKNYYAMFMYDLISSTDSIASVRGADDLKAVYQIANSGAGLQNEKTYKLLASTLPLMDNRDERLQNVYSLGVSNLSIYNSSEDEKLTPVLAGKDTIYTLPEFFRRAADNDYKKLSYLISSIGQKQNLNDIDAEMMKELIAFTYLQLQQSGSMNPSIMNLEAEKLKALINDHLALAMIDLNEERKKKSRKNLLKWQSFSFCAQLIPG